MHICLMMTIAIALLLSACAGPPVRTANTAELVAEAKIPGLASSYFGEPISVPPVATLFTLSAEQEAKFLSYFNDPAHASEAPHRRIFNYLERTLWDFRYYGATRTPAETLSADEGNCLSLALLTTALARLAKVEIAYQRISDEPVFERHGSVVLVADHVRSLLFDPNFQPDTDMFVFGKPHIVIDYFPDRRRRSGGRVSEQTLKSMFYTNLAGEAMADNRNREAFWLLRAALEQDPANVGALNSLAVLHRRAGYEAIAEALYLHALDRYGDTPNLLSNYRALLLAQGRQSAVAKVDRRLALLPVRNPFNLLELGNYAYLQGRTEQALVFYRKALDQAPYLHEAYWRQALVYHSLGMPDEAEKLLLTAADTAGRARDKQLYQAKALSLREQSGQ